MAYGAPCIQLIRLGGGEQSTLFTIRVVIAEVESGKGWNHFSIIATEYSTNECSDWLSRQSVVGFLCSFASGISLWEGVVHGNSRYGAMQKNFHTFTSSDSTYAIQFVK